ncbi:MAG: TonB-dependent receptor [Ectothiorhodospiraceae bacterium]|nr:TonB-dependent receptor [Ectothiorhodospiraceae bacterium]
MLLCLAATVPVAAEEVARLLPETVVSAAAIPVPSREVGSAISVVDRAAIERRQVPVLSDVLRAVPGLAVSRSGPVGGQTQVRMRGAEANHTLVLIDGIEVNDPVSSSEFDFAHMLADDIERIEVLRGPQSALWGADAIGGVIDITTRRAEPGTVVSGRAEGGAHGTFRVHSAVRNAGESHDVALSASALTTEGVNASRFGGEDDGYRNLTLNLNAGLRPDDALDLRATLRATDANTEFDDFDFVAGSPTQGFPIDAANDTDVSQLYAGARARFSVLDGRWEHEVSTGYTRSRLATQANRVRNTSTRGERRKIAYRTTVFAESEVGLPASHALTLLAERERLRFSNRGLPGPSLADQDRETTAYGFAAEYRVSIADRLALGASARHDENERFADADTFRLTAAYDLRRTGSRLHASLGTGVTNPTFFEQFGFFPGFFVGNPSLEPERSRGWDVGVEQRLLDDRVVLDVTWFESDLTNEVATVFDPVTFLSSPVNLPGESRRRGLELSARARLTPTLGASASYTFLRAEQSDGRDEARRPRHTGSVSLDWRDTDDRAAVSVSLDFGAGAVDDEFVFATPQSRVDLGSYALLNVAGRYRIAPSVSALARVENLLDDGYEEVYGFRAPGLGVFVGLAVDFGNGR